MGSLFGKKPKGPEGPKGAAAWYARAQEQQQSWASNPLDPRPSRVAGAIPRTVFSAFSQGR